METLKPPSPSWRCRLVEFIKLVSFKNNYNQNYPETLQLLIYFSTEPVFTDVNLADKFIYPLNWLI